jgi:5-methylcytosine-specific restriction enzyme A
MNTWLFAWNQEKYAWDDSVNGYTEAANETRTLGFHINKWTCGTTKTIRMGDRIFLIRLGKEPRGIIAAGYSISSIFEGTHWDEARRNRGITARRVYIRFDRILDFKIEKILSFDSLLDIASDYHWSTQMSGVSIPLIVSEKLEVQWHFLLATK